MAVKVTSYDLGQPHNGYFPDGGPVKVVESGNVIALTVFQKPSQIEPPPVRKLSADTYLDLRTNEIKEYSKSENRADNVQSLKRTFGKLRNLINANVTTPRNLRWVTLTYAENMTDKDRLYTDFDKFYKRFKYYCKTHEIPKPEYISVVEPQGRGAWHIHLLLIWDGPAPYLHNDTVFAPLWGHGFTKIKAVRDNVDNLGAYFSAYLADIPLDDLSALPDVERAAALKRGCEIVEKTVVENGVKRKKAIIKGGRLNLYPSGMNLYRASRGIKKPETTWTDYETAKKKVRSAKRTYARDYEIAVNDETQKEESVIAVRKEYYNTRCCDCQGVSDKNLQPDFQDLRVSADIISVLLRQPSEKEGGAP